MVLRIEACASAPKQNPITDRHSNAVQIPKRMIFPMTAFKVAALYMGRAKSSQKWILLVMLVLTNIVYCEEIRISVAVERTRRPC
jgi:hypothetical protein